MREALASNIRPTASASPHHDQSAAPLLSSTGATGHNADASGVGHAWPVPMVEHQRVAVRILKERHVADAGVEGFAGKGHASTFERRSHRLHIVYMQRERVAERVVLEAHLLRVHEIQRQVSGLE